MHTEMRSRLVLATAVLAAAVIPVTATNAGSATSLPSTAKIALSGLDSPLSELLATANVVNADLFGTGVYTSPFPLYTGIVRQFIYDALPIVSQLGYNGLDYLDNSIQQLLTGPTSTAVSLADAAWTLVPNIIHTGLGPALQTLLGQISQAGHSALDALSYVVTGLASHLLQVVGTTVSYSLPNILSAAIGGVSAVAQSAVTILSQFAKAIGGHNLTQAWNVAVDGLLGPLGADGTITSSIPGTLEALTLGNGIGVYGTPSYAPSMRIAIQGAVYATANDLGGNSPRPAAAVNNTPPAAAAAASATAARSGTVKSGATRATAAKPPSSRAAAMHHKG